MSDVSEFFSHQGPIGRDINALAAGVKQVAVSDVHAAVERALATFGDYIETAAEEIKAAVTEEINKL